MKIHGYFQTNWISYKELYQMGVVVLYGNIRILAIEPNFYIGVTSRNVLNGFLCAEVLGIYIYLHMCVIYPKLLHTAMSVLTSVFNIASKLYTKYTYLCKLHTNM